MKINKRKECLVKNWQIHHLSISKEAIEKVYPGQGALPMVFTGTVVEDRTGRRAPNDHMRSSLIVSINKERNKIETLNTLYEVMNEGNDIFPDLGDGIMKIFY